MNKTGTPDRKVNDKIPKKEIAIVVFSSVVLGLLIYAPNLFNLSVPIEGDVRAHIFKIDILHDALTQGFWPQWSTYLYSGFPVFQYYPPGFYFSGALLTFITGYAVISYKLLVLLILISNGLVAYYFARKFLKLKFSLAFLCLIAYQTSTPLMLNFIYGAVPNLLAWSVSIIFLAFYLRNVMDGNINKLSAIVMPALLFGITVLIHPFPAIFCVLAIIIFHIIYLVRNENLKQAIKSQLVYFAAVFGIVALLSAHYWLPFMLTREYVSPIYTFTEDAWKGGMPFFLILAALALIIGLIIRLRVTRDIKLDILIAYVVLATVLGLGISRYAPFGLGSLIHEVRFATMAAPLFSLLLIAFSLNAVPPNLKERNLGVAFISVCLVLMTSVLPLIYTYDSIRFDRLYSYTQDYLQPEYENILTSVTDGRLITPIDLGSLCEGDSPVTFGWYYDVENINGPYNQGDPSFFKYTVHLEWEERWLYYEFTRENLMREGAARYVFIRSLREITADMEGLTLIADNNYGKLWQLDENVAHAVSVTPILLDVQDAGAITEFFNILLPDGYKMVFVDINEADSKLRQKFEYVMLDDESKIAGYESKTIFLLNNSEQDSNLVTEEGNIVKLNLPYISYTNELFYQGDKGDVAAWRFFDRNNISKLGEEMTSTLKQAGNEISEYLSRLGYEPAEYEYNDNRIEVSAEPGFTLIKDSYFPYWETEQRSILATSQGFMLIYTNDTTAILDYKKPAINTLAIVISIVGLSVVVVVLIIGTIKRKRAAEV